MSMGREKRISVNSRGSEQIASESESSGWKFSAEWNPSVPTMASACSLDGHIDIYTFSDFKTSTYDNPPGAVLDDHTTFVDTAKTVRLLIEWLKRPATSCFGFGGTIVTVGQVEEKKSQIAVGIMWHIRYPLSDVQFHSLTTDNTLLERARGLQNAIKDNQIEGALTVILHSPIPIPIDPLLTGQSFVMRRFSPARTKRRKSGNS